MPFCKASFELHQRVEQTMAYPPGTRAYSNPPPRLRRIHSISLVLTGKTHRLCALKVERIRAGGKGAYCSHRLRKLFLRFQSHLGQPVTQRITRQPEEAGGLAFVSTRAAKRFADYLPLIFIQGQTRW